MKARELIAALNEVDPEAVVIFTDGDMGLGSPVTELRMCKVVAKRVNKWEAASYVEEDSGVAAVELIGGYDENTEAADAKFDEWLSNKDAQRGLKKEKGTA